MLDINIVEIPAMIKIFCVVILPAIKLLKRYRIKIPAVTNVDECTFIIYPIYPLTGEWYNPFPG